MAKNAVFDIASSEAQAERIANQLKTAGFPGDDISTMFPDQTGTRDFAHDAATGAGAGGLLGDGLGWRGILGPALAGPRSHDNIAEKIGATGEELRASAPPSALSANGPSVRALCYGASK
jgi:hypothetical protein